VRVAKGDLVESELAAITYHPDDTADTPLTKLDTANSRESGLYDDVEPQPRTGPRRSTATAAR